MGNFLQEKLELTSEDKKKWWDNGEWVDELDFIEFSYENHDCIVRRVIYAEGINKEHMFGGHLCGYVKLSQIIKDDLIEHLDVHVGITYDDFYKNDRWIGFDCAHSFDYIPSLEFLYKTDPKMIEIRNKTRKTFEELGLDYENSPINCRIYRNVDFCINECKKIVDQINLSRAIT